MPYISDKVIKKHQNDYGSNNLVCKNFEHYFDRYCSTDKISNIQSNKCKLINEIFLKKCLKK